MTRSITSRVEDMERSLGVVQSEIGSLNENFQSEIGSLKKMLESLLKQREDSPLKPLSPSNSDGLEANNDRERSNFRSNHDGNRFFFAIKGRKLELPVFDGNDPDGWIMQAERYFSLNRLNDEEQLEVSIISFEGDALRWFQWEHKRRPITCWKELKMILLKQFRSVTIGQKILPIEIFIGQKILFFILAP